MSRGPELLRVFNSRRGHQRTQKARKPLAAGDPTGGAYITPQARQHRSRPSPKPHPGSQHFRLPASAL